METRLARQDASARVYRRWRSVGWAADAVLTGFVVYSLFNPSAWLFATIVAFAWVVTALVLVILWFRWRPLRDGAAKLRGERASRRAKIR